jgi:hypothetical protein
MEELGFFTRHIGGGELNDREVSELENKGGTMGYGPRAMLFSREDQILMNRKLYKILPEALVF